MQIHSISNKLLSQMTYGIVLIFYRTIDLPRYIQMLNYKAAFLQTKNRIE